MRDILMINVKSIKIFSEAICSLRKTSKDNHDSNDFYMTNSALSVNNFDLVKDKYIRELSLSEHPKSSDAFYVSNSGKMYLIEFKNGKVDRNEVLIKIFDSLLILTDILSENISYTRQNLSFILVYNETNNPYTEKEKDEVQVSRSRTYIGERISKLGKENFIRFNLKRFEKLYFKDVLTLTDDDFENYLKNNWSKLGA
jgi:hypothetical protein